MCVKYDVFQNNDSLKMLCNTDLEFPSGAIRLKTALITRTQAIFLKLH